MRILRNPVAVVVTLGVAIIPSLYAWFNILANWDPYSSTGNLQVAVANEDKGTTSDLVGRLDAGKQVVSQLKKNDRLGWTFVSADKAVEGVQSGEYYAAIVLPKDFSASLINSITGSSDKPNIIYYVNEKKNAIAPKITDTGATTIDSQINATFVSTVSKTLVQTMTKEGGKLSQSADGTRTSVVNDLNGLIEQLNDIDSSLGRMGGTFDDAKKGIKQAKSTVASLKRQISSAQKAAKQSQKLLTQVQGSAQSFSSSLAGAFDNGSVQLSGIGVSVNNAAGDALSAFNTAQGSIDDITNVLQKPIDGAATLSSDLKDAMNKAGIGRDTAIGKQIWQQIDALDKTVNTQQSQLDAFHKDTSQFISSGKSAATSLSDATSTATGSGIGILNRARTGTVTPNLTAGLSNFATLSGTIDGTLSSLSSTLGQSDSLFDELSDTLSQAKTTVAGTQKSLADLTDSVSGVRTDIAALGSSATYQKIKQALNIDGDSFGEFMGTPVKLSTKSVYPMDNYGSAVTPFYTNLALWVGGFVLIAIFKLEVDDEGLGRFTANQGYFGRWMLMVLLGFVQSIIVCAGDLALGIQCEHPALFMLAGVFTSFVYVNIIYALAISFKHIGKAIGVILVIVQIPGSSGMYPIEMMPGFFQWLHPLLPFTYGINLLRETVGGMYSFNYLFNLCILGVFLIVALFIGLQLRPLLLNLNLLFDKQLSTTGMMICESNDLPRERYSLRTAMRVVLDSDSYRRELLDHAVAFEHRYPYYIKGGFAAVVGVQVLLFVLSTVLDIDNNGKIILLVIWIISVIAICGWLINIEYIRASLNTQMRISALSDEDLRREMREHTAAIPAARRMFGLNASERGAKDGDQSTGRLPHIGLHHKSQGSDSTATNDGDTTPLGKHSKGGEA